MSELGNLQADLKKYQREEKKAKYLQNLQVLPAWKSVVEEGFIQDFAADLVTQLVDAPIDKRNDLITALTGISALSKYLKDTTTKGNLAESNIKETEAAITELLQET